MALAGRLYRPKAKSFWVLVRRLLLCKSHRRPAAGGAEEDRREEKSGLLSRSSLEQLLVTDAGGPGDSDVVVCRSAKKHGQPVAVLARPEAAAVSSAAAVAGRDCAVVGHRRFAFGGFRRRLLMRRPWRPELVAIPE